MYRLSTDSRGVVGMEVVTVARGVEMAMGMKPLSAVTAVLAAWSLR